MPVLKDHFNNNRTNSQELEIQINKFLSVRTINDRIVICVNGKQFLRCEFVNLIDEAEILYNENQQLDSSLKDRLMGYASDLQVWAENDYDTSLLHRNLAFPLLKRLVEVEDLVAKRVFKEEIASRIESGYFNVIYFLLYHDYLQFFDDDETIILLENIDLYKFENYNFIHLISLIIKKLRQLAESSPFNSFLNRIIKNILDRTVKLEQEYRPIAVFIDILKLLDATQLLSFNIEAVRFALITIVELSTPNKRLRNLSILMELIRIILYLDDKKETTILLEALTEASNFHILIREIEKFSSVRQHLNSIFYKIKRSIS